MPLDRRPQTDRLTTAQIPDLAEDEYIEIRHVRDFARDVEAEMHAQRYLPPVPEYGETEEAAAAREPTLRRHDGIYWRAVWEYMCVRLHVRDQDGAWLDAHEPRGTAQDRDLVFAAWGPFLWAAFAARFGSAAPPLNGKANAEGGPLTFRAADRLRPAGDLPGAAEPGRADGGRTLPAAQDGAGPHPGGAGPARGVGARLAAGHAAGDE